MGRPINKKHIGDGAGKIQVTAVRFAGEVETLSGVETYIVKQKSTRKFLVANAAKPAGGVCTLVKTNPGLLGEGEFCISSTDNAGLQSQVTKLYNRVCILEGVYKTRWARTGTGTMPAVEAEILSISRANPGSVVTDAAHTFTTGDKVSVRGCQGMVEANTNSPFTITVVNPTTFTLGVNTTGYTAHTGGSGVATQAPDAVAGQADVQHIDSQAS